MLSPEYERAAAARIKAKTTVLNSSHVAMLAKPDAVAAVIEDAASNAVTRSAGQATAGQ
jgi:hypothetical protein